MRRVKRKEYSPKLQENLETCLLEVVIARESFGKIALLHHHKADTVNLRPNPCLIDCGTIPNLLHRARSYMYDFYPA